ncbi:uncharacterized protein LODBEIA_P44290 [Lodderomyces beijingensis]|uniref:CN hydrolase domain-containing protein n=1 Tax=Lodderomyces beijingensis TaxID=1775926 RepID=A0ABP0ZSL7_9ASCO
MKLKVAIVQIDSILGQPRQNITKVQKLLSTIKGKFPDLVVLSELALTGYNFTSSSHIKPYLESATNYGPSLNFARELSSKHRCITVIGYPESHKDTIYNSCAVFSRQGQLVHNYRKTFLYETDEVWGCSENPDKSFRATQLDFSDPATNNPSLSSTVTNFGICMDLNPYKFEAPFNAFEFSSACFANRSKLIICPMAWLSPESPSIQKEAYPTLQQRVQIAKELKLPREPCTSTINYWILRFFPFLTHEYSFPRKWWRKEEKVCVLCCNRVGKEGDIVYGGSSAILRFNNDVEAGAGHGFEEVNSENASVDVVDSLSQSEEGIIVQEIDI